MSHERVLHLVYAYRCNLFCKHCIYRCGPWEGQSMGLRRGRGYLDQAAGAGIQRIVLNGGEPLLAYAEVTALIRHTHALGMQPSLMTNGSWGVSRSRAQQILEELARSGLHSITLSTDRYHLVHVPLRFLLNILEAARNVGIPAGVKIARLPHDTVAEGLRRTLCTHTRRISLQDIVPAGRGARLATELRRAPPRGLKPTGCATPAVLLPNGSLLTCCNLPAQDLAPNAAPLVLGNLAEHSLAELLARRRSDPLLRALRFAGPAPLVFAVEGDRDETSRWLSRRYHDACELCHLYFRAPSRVQEARELLRTGTHAHCAWSPSSDPGLRRDA